MIKYLILLPIFFCVFISNGQDNQIPNLLEVSLGLHISNAKYPTGVGVSFSSGATEAQSWGFGWHLMVSKIFISKSILYYEPAFSLKSYSYRNQFYYPIDYTVPRVLDENYDYFFSSIDNRILFKILDHNKLIILPFAGFCVNLILNSKLKRNLDINGEEITTYSNLTKSENTLNLSYEAGIKMVLVPNRRHPITASISYNHFLNEQFALGAGKIIYAFGVGVGYRF